MTGQRESEHGTAALRESLQSKRWFGEKGREILSVELSDVIPVRWPDSGKEHAVARARITTGAGTVFYQLFLPAGNATVDALEDESFRRGLVDAFATGATFEANGARWTIDSEGDTPLVVPASTCIELSTAQQSNSSLIVGSAAMLKLFRKLAPGVHPDLEVTRFLTTKRRFPHTPVLLGTVHFEDSAGVSVAGMLQELIPGAVDGWTYALARSSEYVQRSQADRPMPFEREAEQIGGVTRALHEALASGDPGSGFEAPSATADDVRRWAQGATDVIDRASHSLERAAADGALPRDRVAEARSIAQRRHGYIDWMSDLAGEIGADAGASARIHGDYHLGQVLHSAADQFFVIDFEGEPSRPLEERRARSSPLRDVAGMLRSFSYAAAVAGSADRWERGTRDAFLRGYFGAGTSERTILPQSRNNAARLLALFEAEKVFYELEYELDHRPDWVWIPLRGIAKLYS